ncbi:MAG: hypothetical protein IJB49_03290 [Clostridia bacterium]|nr:hypothetical protein [Clostridia bacterium]
MKYLCKDRLDVFGFHDSVLSFVSLDSQGLTVSAKLLNVLKNTEFNPSDLDMEIERAIIRFNGFRALSYETGGAFINGINEPLSPTSILTDKRAELMFRSRLDSGITVFDLDALENGVYFIDAITSSRLWNENFFTLKFSFESVTVEWERYFNYSWYEREKGKEQ